jgi:hypothetical protein
MSDKPQGVEKTKRRINGKNVLAHLSNSIYYMVVEELPAEIQALDETLYYNSQILRLSIKEKTSTQKGLAPPTVI